MINLPDCLKDSKCIIHIDLDCFFSQVEEVRLGLDSSKPVAVQQWSSLIAVNYAARRYGVNRLISIDEARGLCPDITLVHVPTYAPNETEACYHTTPSRITHKSALDTYYNEGKKIFKIFHQHCPQLQKVNSDEAFLDMTTAVNERLCTSYISKRPELMDYLMGSLDGMDGGYHVDWTTSSTHLIPSLNEKRRGTSYRDPSSWFDIQLAIAADLTAAIRKQVFDELHYTCSAGIAHNKTLAKLGSSMHKPNKQTVIRRHIASQFMEDIPFTKIWNLGGKFGKEVKCEYNIQKAGDLWKYSLEELQHRFGDTSGLWLYNIVRGIDDEEVNVIKGSKSLMSTKSIYPPITSEQDLIPWYAVLSAELHSRIITNWNERHLWPKTLSISYKTSKQSKTISKSTPMLHQCEAETSEKLREKVKVLFEDALDDLFPCTLLGVHATGLAPMSSDASNSNNNRTIKSFFTSTAPITPASSRLEPSSSHANKRPAATSMNPNEDPLSTKPPLPTGLTWICDRCNARVPLENVDEHTDYHFAIDLDNEEHQTDGISGEKRKDFQDDPMTKTITAEKRAKHLFFKPSS